MTKTLATITVVSLGIGAALAFEDPPNKDASVIGRWDLTVRDGDREYPSWLEVRKSGRKTLVGTYVGEFGSARPIANVHFKEGGFSFVVPPQWEKRKDDVSVIGRLDGQSLQGMTTNDKGGKVTFEGRRAPALTRDRTPEWGDAVELVNDRDLADWKPRAAETKNGWVVKDGVLMDPMSRRTRGQAIRFIPTNRAGPS